MVEKHEPFTASNGWRVNADGSVDGFEHLEPSTVDALRDLFAGERDHELRRWRDPEASYMVCYPWFSDPDMVTVLRESDGYTDDQRRQNTLRRSDTGSTADRYFAAHPVKAWLDAKPGEVWGVTLNGQPAELALVEPGEYTPPRFRFSDGGTTVVDGDVIDTAVRLTVEEEK